MTNDAEPVDHHVDEDLVDFLDRHQFGNCADCECSCDDCRLDRIEVSIAELRELLAENREMLAEYLRAVSL